MRLHVVSLPHTQTTRAYDHCAFTAKVRKFADMMSGRGHEVVLYAGEENEAACAEHVQLVSRAEQDALFRGYEWWQRGEIYGLDWNMELPHWRLFNDRAVAALLERVHPRDFVCLITGSQAPIVAALPGHRHVEFGVGYEGILPDTFHAFESYAWMHAVYASPHVQGSASRSDGKFFDAVIPNYYDVDEFPRARHKENYVLFMSRMTQRKGYEIAIDATRIAGLPLKIAGVGGDRPEAEHVEYVGLVHKEQRSRLLSRARAVMVPTIYVEPFGGVAAEALLCGTPVVTTDWGAFPEYVQQGADGFRCRTLREFADALHHCDRLDRRGIRGRAQARFGYEAVGAQFEQWFDRLALLWREGFYAGT